MQKSIQILIGILSVLFLSCSNDLRNNVLPKANEGSLRIGITIPESKDPAIATLSSRAKATLTPPEIADFSIKIFQLNIDSEPKEIFSQLYGELPYMINLTEGDYRIEAQIGKHDLFSTESPLYLDQQEFSITRGQTTNLSLVATIVPYVVQINYSKDFTTNFQSYYIEAEINDQSGHIFANHDGDNHIAYLMPSKCRLILKGVLKDGNNFSSVIKEIDSPGKELYTLNLNVLPKGHSIDISVNTTRIEISSQGEIPLDRLPDLPAISTTPLEFYETMATPVEGSFSAITFGSIAGVASIEFTPLGDGFNSLGLASGTTYNTANAADLAALTAAGVSLPADLVCKQSSIIDFSALAQALLSNDGSTTDHLLQCKVTDITGKVGAVSNITFRIRPAVFSMPDVLAGNIWCKSATASPLQVEHGDLNYIMSSGRLKYQFSTDNSTWSDLTSEQLSFTNLSSNATYYLRGLYRDAPTNTISFTTETPMQIPGSDLNNWSSTNPVSNNPTFTINNGWWATRNSITNSEGGNYFYCRMSGTKPIDGGVSGKGAELLTIGWGSGNTCAFGGSISSSKVAYISAAMLFVGEYNGGEKHGKPFKSKPTALSFHYKYDPYNNDKCRAEIQIKSGDQIIGQALFQTPQAVTSFTKVNLPVVYDPQYNHLAPTTICIIFKSGDNEGSKDYLKDWVNYGGSFYSGYSSQGSKFYVDEISLAFDK